MYKMYKNVSKVRLESAHDFVPRSVLKWSPFSALLVAKNSSFQLSTVTIQQRKNYQELVWLKISRHFVIGHERLHNCLHKIDG